MTVATKAAAKAPAKRAPTKRAPAKAAPDTVVEPVDTVAINEAARAARAQEVADFQVNAATLNDALSAAHLPRLRLSQLYAARGGVPAHVWRESTMGNLDDQTRAAVWAVVDEYVDEDLARAIRVREHVRGVAAPYLEKATS